ncbi:MAG TPA: hypothetical protein VK404_08915 [Spirosoma sp.]|nr:hypothetical protein [Spirosoma sp.]
MPNMDCLPIPFDASGSILEKGVRKEVQKVAQLQEAGTFPQQMRLGSVFLQHRKNGGRFFEYMSETSNTPHYLKVRGTDRMLTSPQELRFVSGPCLFSISGAQVVHKGGSMTTITKPDGLINKPVEGLQVQECITLYELESIERLTRTISEYIQGINVPSRVAVNIPRTEYYLYMLDAFQQGLVGIDTALEWFDQVDKRSGRMRDLFISRLRKNASTADVTLNNLNDSLADFVRDHVSRGTRPPLDKMIGMYAHQNKISSALVQMYQPESYQDLNNLGYLYEEIVNGVEEGVACVVIENPVEEKIYVECDRAAKALKPLGITVNTMAVYPYPQVVMTNDDRGLYFLPGTPTLTQVKPVLRQYR